MSFQYFMQNYYCLLKHSLLRSFYSWHIRPCHQQGYTNLQSLVKHLLMLRISLTKKYLFLLTFLNKIKIDVTWKLQFLILCKSVRKRGQLWWLTWRFSVPNGTGLKSGRWALRFFQVAFLQLVSAALGVIVPTIHSYITKNKDIFKMSKFDQN